MQKSAAVRAVDILQAEKTQMCTEVQGHKTAHVCDGAASLPCTHLPTDAKAIYQLECQI